MGRESTRRGDRRLLPEGRRRRPDHARDSRRKRTRDSQVRQHRSRPSGAGQGELALVLVPSATGPGDLAEMTDAMDGKLADVAGPDASAGRGGRGGGGGGRGGRGGGGPPRPESFGSIQGTLLGPANALQAADATPTIPTVAAANDR